MATYAIGDLQGCFAELQDLLYEINFDEGNDCLWFAGDIINRGPESLACLMFVKQLGDKARMVLGNHDLHLFGVQQGIRKAHKSDTFDEILAAENSHELIQWLLHQPLLLHEPELDFTLVHAGLPPQWSLIEAMQAADEVKHLLSSQSVHEFLPDMYGNQPDMWSNHLTGHEHFRYVINCFTRMRYVDNEGRLDFSSKKAPGSAGNGLTPWYAHPQRQTRQHKLAFGHWSTVTLGTDKNFSQWNVYPLDTGCLWGGELSALRLEDERWFSVPSRQDKKI